MEAAFIGAKIWTGNKNSSIIDDGILVVEGDSIIAIGKDTKIIPRGYDRIVLSSKDVITPGFINSHTHQAMTLLRGYSDDKELHSWLNDWIFPFESNLESDDVYQGALLGAVESIRSGTTTVNSMYHFPESEAKAIVDAGIRGVVAAPAFIWSKENPIKTFDNLEKKFGNQDRIKLALSPHAPYTCSPNQWIEIANHVKEWNQNNPKNIFVHAHIAETKIETKLTKEFLENNDFKAEASFFKVSEGIIEYLEHIGVTNAPTLAAHGVYLTNRDQEIAKDRNINFAHNPVSNLKLASGVADIPQLIDKGITIGLGTDGTAANNRLDMVDTMRITSLLHKGAKDQNPTNLPANKVLKMATCEGALSIFWPEIGSLDVNKKADFCIFDFNKPHLTPIYNIESHLIYSAYAHDIFDVIIAGKYVLKDKVIQTIDEEELMESIHDLKNEILQRLKNN